MTPLLHRMGPLSNAVEYAGMIATAGWAAISHCGFLLFPPPKYRETDDNGQDRPEARQANRRVEVIFSKP
ncbi:hypothetical protein [Ensifer adhaerens]|uniref:hypothetical protein n=1 Tax=Ensifer adhaerens TaxID=106592 RepID=UPI0015681BDB|nr:hypothetical protein [Ensifer adhaerens]